MFSSMILVGGVVATLGAAPLQTIAAQGAATGPADPYVGHHDITTCERVAGWIWVPERPGDTVRVDLFEGDRLVASIRADRYRRDLEEAGIGTGLYGFEYTFPDSARIPSTVEVRVAGTDLRLRNTPRPNPCATRVAPPTGRARVNGFAGMDPATGEAWWAGGDFRSEADRYVGHHDVTTCEVVSGWVWMPDQPEDTVHVDLLEADRLIASIPADRRRSDLEEGGVGTGLYGFRYTLPDSLPPPATVEVLVAGTDVRLQRTPQANPCVPGAVVERREPDRKVMRPERIEPGSVRVDARLDEALWARAEVHTDFLQKALDRGVRRPAQTAVALAYDRASLYVGARLQSRHMDSVDTRLDRRDEGGNADRILVSLDPYRNRRTAYTFGVTATGVRIDHYHPGDSEDVHDDSFDPVWEARTRIDEDGWTAEMRIPFSQLRFDAAEEMTWGINIRRWSPQEHLNLYWVVVPMAEAGWASRFGDLEGLRDVGSGVRLELAPYLLAGAIVPVGAEPGTPAESMSRFGGDAKLGLGSGLTLDLTVNPDFGQVEVDPAEVNLTAFETAFPEHRPFFLEGTQLFQPRGPRYFHSRRIGSVHEAGMPDHLGDGPDAARIVGAAKLTGRLGAGTVLGGLVAHTAEVYAPSVGVADDTLERNLAAPATTFMVGRIRQDFGAPGSSVGLLVTGLDRRMAAESPIAQLLAETAVAGGADGALRFADGTYELSGHVGGSLIHGDAGAIARVQRSSAHYFQRPDAEVVRLDETRTSLAGYTAGLGLEKRAGRRWVWSLAGGLESPGFEIRDLGTFRAADHIDASATLGYRQLEPSGPFRWYTLTLGADAAWNFEGIRQFASPSLDLTGVLPNLLRTWIRASYEAPALSDDLTRGGPLMEVPAAREIALGLQSPFKSSTQWSLSGTYRADRLGGWMYTVDTGFSWRPHARVSLSLHPGFLRAVDKRQFWGAWPDGRPETYGQRYVFGSIDRETLYAQLRADFPLTPDLGIQLYLEPFVSTGHYYDFGELTRPRRGDLLIYGTEGSTLTVFEDRSIFAEDLWGSVYIRYPDFTVKSLRSSAVLRWEWLRGSALHLVWQQNRWSSVSGGEPVGAGSLFDTLAPAGENILTAKVTYRFGMF